MVAVDDLDPPGEAKIKSESTGVPPSAPPKDAFAERGESMPRDHTWSRASIVGGSGALRHRPEGGSLCRRAPPIPKALPLCSLIGASCLQRGGCEREREDDVMLTS